MKPVFGHKSIGLTVALLGTLVLSFPAGAVLAQTPPFYDSQIVTVTTLATPPPVNLGAGTYSLVCAPSPNSAIYLGWTANASPAVAGTVYAFTNPTFRPIDGTVVTTANSSGNYLMTVTSGAPKYFEILGSGYSALSNVVGPCSPLSPVSSDAPTQLNVFTNGPATLYLNWKDNSTSTATSTFEIQRFQVTPVAPSNLSVTQAAGSMTLHWTDNNPTGGPPFYAIVERSNDTSAAMRFDPMNDPTLVTSTVKQGNTSLTDANGLVIGTNYYYRVKDVSQLPVSNFYQIVSGSTVAKPGIASSTYGTLLPVTYTPPVGINLLKQSLGSVIGWLFGAPVAEGQTSPTVNYDNYFATIASNVTTPFYPDSGLTPGTVYMYRVRLTKGSSSTWSNMVAAVTLPSGSLPSCLSASPSSCAITPICTAYGYCDRSVAGYRSPDFSQTSESQCSVNADCRNVGRASTQTQEQ